MNNLIGELFSPLKNYKSNIVLTLVVTSAVTLTYILTQQFKVQIILLSLILVYILSLIISKIPYKIKIVLVAVITVYALITNVWVTVSGIIVVFISIVVIEIARKLLTSVSREALQDDYKIEDLKVGMIPAYNLYENDEKTYFDDKSFFSRIKETLSTGDMSRLSPPKDKLVVTTMAAGLTKDDIETLKELKDKGKLVDKFKIKKGVPFAPSILIGLIISLFIGDLAFIIEKILMTVFYGPL